jgi:uracil-DNA glycosylase
VPSGRSSGVNPGSEASSRRLRARVVACRRCPRLVAFRESVRPRGATSNEEYWRRPVPGFGDVNGRLLVLGIAPAARGGNRTGRVFTGDSSGRFLVRALHAAGFASKPVPESIDDGLTYHDCYVTAAVKCAPPGDRPTREEFANCSSFLDEEIRIMKNLKAVLALGALAFRSYMDHVRRVGGAAYGLQFSHGSIYRIRGGPTVYASYHPSPRNTNTGRLTQVMLAGVVKKIKSDLEVSGAQRIISQRLALPLGP